MYFRRRGFLSRLLPAALLIGVISACQAAEVPGAETFDEARFKALQVDDAVVLVHVAADWCAICNKQKKVLAKFEHEHTQSGLHVLRVDFDRQKDWVRHFKAPRQSALILYKGSEQRWFSVGETRKDVIFAELLKLTAP